MAKRTASESTAAKTASSVRRRKGPTSKPDTSEKDPAKPKAQRAAKPKPKPEKTTFEQAEAKKPAGSESQAQESGTFDAEALLQMEQISLNIAKAAVTAQTAMAAALSRQGGPQALPGSLDPFEAAPAMSEVVSSLVANPDKIVEAQNTLFNGYLSLWGAFTRKALDGQPVTNIATGKPDRRFSDPQWTQNMMFEMMKESYLLSSNWLNQLVGSVEGVDESAKRRVEFLTKLMTDAFSPSNFLMSNPGALQTLIDTKGESLVKGMARFAEDIDKGGGKLAITQTDTSKFSVGENLATTPGKVIYRNPFFELIQYAPVTDQVRKIPLLIFPPWINKYYILDLQPKNSIIKWLTEQGFTVFITSWVNPGPHMKDASFEDYMFGGIYDAIEQVKAQTGSEKVNTVGYCIGGTLLGCALAHMAERGYDSVASATFFTAQHDFSDAGDLSLFTTESWLKELEIQMDAAGGVLPGSAMADTFNTLRSNDLIWSSYVNNYLMGKDPTAFDLLCWNADVTRMPKALHMFYLRRFYAENALTEGQLVLDGVRIDLSKVTIPVFEQAAREDHIAPAASVYRGSKMFGGPVTYVLAGSGHIAGVVNHPASQKYQHWVNPEHPATLKEWLNGAEEKPGSWWPLWANWLHEKSDNYIAARNPDKGPLKPLMDAPGSYVLVKS